MLGNVLIFIVSCEFLDLLKPYASTYYEHLISKCCQYVISEEKMCMDMKKVFLKDIQIALQRMIA